MNRAHQDSTEWLWLETLFYDLRSALRGLRRDRVFSLTAIAMLALAIGLNLTVFTVMNTMLFRGFPLVQGNDRLVYMQERFPSGLCCLSYADFEDWRSQAHAFEGMAFANGRRIAFSERGHRPVDMSARGISTNAFRLLKVSPMLGRDFVPADESPGAAPVAIIAYRFWENRFNKRSDIVGLTVEIDRTPATIIGVMPDGFDFPEQQNIWMPLLHSHELEQRGPGGYLAFGRLRDGVGLQEARAELRTINSRLEAEYPATNRGVVPRVDAHAEFFIGPDAPIIYGSLWAGAWFVLLIVCANLANLALARSIGQSHEVSTRIALGASQARMMRQILMESLLLSGIAGTLGWWLAKWSVRTWTTATASRFQVLDYTMDSGTLAYLVGITAVAAILLSLVPIFRTRQLRISSALKGDVRGVTLSSTAKDLAAALMAVQMVLAIVLLSGSGVLVRSLLNIVRADTGVDNPDKVLIGSMRLPSEKYSTPIARLAYFDRLEAQLRTIPGIDQESVGSTIPVGSGILRTFDSEGQPDPSTDGKSAQFLSVGSDYFRVLGAAVKSGRDFNDEDLMTSLSVAIVNESFVDSFWLGQQPIGKRLRTTDRNKAGEWRTVVGVVPNIMHGDALRQRFKPVVYVPFRQNPSAFAFFLLRTWDRPDLLAQTVRAAVQRLDADVVLEDFTTLKASFAFNRDGMDLEHAELGKYAAVAPIFAGIALLVAAVGLFALVDRSVSYRTKEIGIRIAVGAAAADIRKMVFVDGMLPVAAGMIVGLATSLAVNRIFQSQLVGVSPYDPITMTAGPVILVSVALLACHFPARRAMNVDPVVALRHD